mmetsp:Transcript_3812/g.11338  ORF Transcript_3812/g.11338 Transcript_3812/m.11338 type:complete len:164 (+) Transcript_3812:287-778(+)
MAKKPSKATTKKAPNASTDAKKKKASPSLPAGGYEAMVSKAIKELGERGGSSPVAILRAITKDHPEIPEDRLKLQVRMALKRMTQKEKLVKVKASYKLNGPEKEKKAKAAEKKTAKKTTKPKATIAKKKKATKSAAKAKAPKVSTKKKAAPKAKTTQTRTLRK